ncbi:lipoyl(octanoyl) transferase LipB [Thiogranum longum]
MSVLRIRKLGICDYPPVWREMQSFTARRNPNTQDELWLLQHEPVFTLGMNAKPEHLLSPGDIPVVSIDRGGQVTYHGPGQLVAYVLLDLRRLGIGVRRLVEVLESSVIDWMAAQGLTAQARRDAPGVYVGDAKIAALGLRVRRGCSYHGLSLNVNMDLEPFERINPCGYKDLAVTQIRDLGVSLSVEQVAQDWIPYLASQLGYTVRVD